MPYQSISTQFPGGFTNAAPFQTMSEAGTPDPSWSQLFHHEFNTFGATDFTQSGTGAPAYALQTASGPGGIIGLTTSTNVLDSANLVQPVPSFQMTPNKHQFFKARFALSAGANSTVYVGLVKTAALANDGLFFYKAAGGTWVLRSMVGNAVTDIPLPAACVAVDGAFCEVGFHVDVQGNVEIFWNPTTGANMPAAGGFRGRVASLPNASLTQALLGVGAGIQTNSPGSAVSMFVDFLTMSAER